MGEIDWDAVWDGIGYPRPHCPEVSDWTVQVQSAVEAQLAERGDKLAKAIHLLKLIVYRGADVDVIAAIKYADSLIRQIEGDNGKRN